MAPRTLRLKRLEKKNYNVRLQVLEPAEWLRISKADPAIPRSVSELRRLGRQVFGRENRPPWPPPKEALPDRGILRKAGEECGETPLNRFFTGLQNPFLPQAVRSLLEAEIDADIPVFEHSLETDHFILRWTNSSAHAEDNIADDSIVTETAGYLETAWQTYNDVFGPPYVAPGETKIEVVFWDISGFGSTTPSGPINLDAPSWIALPGIRQPTSAHELFHRVQYSYGYRTTWTPSGSFQWFSEGSASWGEVFTWSRVSVAGKVTGLFSTPDSSLWNSSYQALPFWIFFQSRQQDLPAENTVLSFLQRYQMLGDERTALSQIIDENWPVNNVYGQLDTFFALFARDRVIGHWKFGPSGALYPNILEPGGASITPTLAVTNVPLGVGDSYMNNAAVSALGTDYYRVAFQPGASGHDLVVSSMVVGGDFSYYLIWEKAGNWVRAEFPFFATGSHSVSQTLDLAVADSVVVAVSGRGTGGSYTLNATIP